jgi:hypothetical protein
MFWWSWSAAEVCANAHEETLMAREKLSRLGANLDGKRTHPPLAGILAGVRPNYFGTDTKS